jgi:cold shock protein
VARQEQQRSQLFVSQLRHRTQVRLPRGFHPASDWRSGPPRGDSANRRRRATAPPSSWKHRRGLCSPLNFGDYEMARGTVKWFNSRKGYEFTQPEDGGKDIFVHSSAVERAGLPGQSEGQTVEFELASNRGKT